MEAIKKRSMEIHQLRYFVAVAETGSFTRAAEREDVTQPTLSEQILRLESKQHGVGRRLFDRLGRKVVLTDAGNELLGHAQGILAAVKEAERAVRDSAEGGSLRVGAIPTVAPFLLPGTVTRFRKDHPTVQLQLKEDLTERLLADLLAGELDVAASMAACRCCDEPLARGEAVHRTAGRGAAGEAPPRDQGRGAVGRRGGRTVHPARRHALFRRSGAEPVPPRRVGAARRVSRRANRHAPGDGRGRSGHLDRAGDGRDRGHHEAVRVPAAGQADADPHALRGVAQGAVPPAVAPGSLWM